MKMNMTKQVIIGVVGSVLAAMAFSAKAEAGGRRTRFGLIPGDRYCGIGNRGGTPSSARDKACASHDENYGRLKAKGVNPYSFTNGNREVIQADWNLANKAQEARRNSTSRGEKAKSLGVEVYMRSKAASNAARYGRQSIKRKATEGLSTWWRNRK